MYKFLWNLIFLQHPNNNEKPLFSSYKYNSSLLPNQLQLIVIDIFPWTIRKSNTQIHYLYPDNTANLDNTRIYTYPANHRTPIVHTSIPYPHREETPKIYAPSG